MKNYTDAYKSTGAKLQSFLSLSLIYISPFETHFHLNLS
jgi:hypothetical protein